MGWFSRFPKQVPDTADADTLIKLAERESDIKFRHALLEKAAALSPDNIKALRALLMLGNLWRRDPNRPDFNLIKCYLLHPFEHPECHDENDRERKAREIFDDPLLARCLHLSQSPNDFMRDYLEELCGEYIRIFIAGDSRNMPRLQGLTFRHSIPKYLSAPMARVSEGIVLSPCLAPPEREHLLHAFYRACRHFLEGQVSYLDDGLSPEALKILGDAPRPLF